MSRKDQPKKPRDVFAAAITRLDARVDRLDALVAGMAGQLERLHAAETARALEARGGAARRRPARTPAR